MKYLLTLTLVLLASVSFCQPSKPKAAPTTQKNDLIIKQDTIRVTTDTSKVIMILLEKGESGSKNYLSWEEGTMIRELHDGKPVSARYFTSNLSREYQRKEIFDARLPEQ